MRPDAIIHIAAHPRAKPRRHRLEHDAVYCELSNIIAAGLERELSELDKMDLEESQRARIVETW